MKNCYSVVIGFLVMLPTLVISQHYIQPNQPESYIRQNPENACKCTNPGLKNPDKVLAIDTTFCYEWPYQGTAWNLESITINNYDEEGRVFEAILKNFDLQTGAYIPVRRYSYEYYDDGALKTDQWQAWNPDMNGGSWSNMIKSQYDFDAEGKLALITTWFSGYDEPDWHDGNKEYYGYDAAGLKDTITVKYWNTIQNAWYFSNRYRYIYDNNQEVIEKYNDWANNLSGSYSLNTRTIYERSSEMNTIDEIEQYWNLNEWVSENHKFNQLNEDDLPVSTLYQNWDPINNTWDTVVMNRELFGYTNGQITQYTRQSYYIAWTNQERNITEYYESGDIAQTQVLDWDSYNQIWVNSEKCEFPEPQNVTSGIDDAFQSEAGVLVSPNPANTSFTVKSDVDFIGIGLYTLEGREVIITQVKGSLASLSTDLLPDGIYFLKIYYPANSITRKLIIKH